MLYRGNRIGIFYNDREWAEKWMNDFVDSIDNSCILRFVKRGLLPFMIELKDGTRITAYPANHNSRGVVIDKAYIQPNVSQEIIDCLIRPLIGHSQKIIVENE